MRSVHPPRGRLIARAVRRTGWAAKGGAAAIVAAPTWIRSLGLPASPRSMRISAVGMMPAPTLAGVIAS